MRKVFLLTGFNNWGKTTLINNLFGKWRFVTHKPHSYAGRDFCVIPQSNDDLGEVGYINAYSHRIKELKKHWGNPSHIFSAFCPTREKDNNASRIISSIYSDDQVYLIPIVYKWCGQAKLLVPEIASHLSVNKNVQIHQLLSKQPDSVKLAELQKVIEPLL